MILLKNRLARPFALALMLSAFSLPTMAETAPTGALDFLKLLRPSISGSFIAGQEAMKDLRTDEAARYFGQAVQGDWDNPILAERAFFAAAADGQIPQAAEMAKHLLDLQKGNELAELVQASVALKERRYGAAERALAQVPQDTFSGITAGILRAWALVGDGRGEEAEQLLGKLGQRGLEDFLVFHRTLMAEASGNKAKALELAEKAYDVEPYVPRVVEIYARMLANDGQFDAALDVINEFEAQGLSHPELTAVKATIASGKRPGVFVANAQIGAAEMYQGIGAALARDGSSDLALVFLRLANYLNPSSDVIPLTAAQLLDNAGQHEAANRIYDAVPANSPMKPAAVVRIAQNLDAIGNRSEALRRLRNIVATNPDDLDAVSALGDLLRYDEQYLDAAAAYSHAIELTGGDAPADWRYYYVRAIAYERAKEWPKAEADFLKALELNPEQPQVLNYLGYSWIDQDMHLERALEMIEKAVEMQPRDGYIVDSLGWAFYKLGRLDDAVETLERAVMLRPNDPEINDHLGDVYWEAGRKLEAGFQWQIAKAMDTEGGHVRDRAEAKLAEGLTEKTASE
ncbi:tetratricopeptide repeat protein [Devosia sp. 63-57]|uniref:tetratricopeptide repeat protein n=1 Tax=Devosia sp. 63-57 TaxID=1895751 RepID=UPI000A57C121|nr:tetratricopeptide repeat protein [Devosia sp. 63-57]